MNQYFRIKCEQARQQKPLTFDGTMNMQMDVHPNELANVPLNSNAFEMNGYTPGTCAAFDPIRWFEFQKTRLMQLDWSPQLFDYRWLAGTAKYLYKYRRHHNPFDPIPRAMALY